VSNLIEECILALARDEITTFDGAARREWLVTNGLGGYAAGTVSGACTRRYHGLLVAALKPPVQRCVLLVKLDVSARYAGETFALACNEYEDGAVDPHGYRHLESFAVDGPVPTWTFAVADARLTQRVWMAQGENTTYLTLSLTRANAPIELEVTPLCTGRDHHWQLRGARPVQPRAIDGGVEIAGFEQAPSCRVVCDRGSFDLQPAWHWKFRHRAESERGLDDVEDLFRPGVFRLSLGPRETATFTCSTQEIAPHAGGTPLGDVRRRQRLLMKALPRKAPSWIARLAVAADQYLVRRGAEEGGATVIAGYPWFADWGRDTMIALPGLTLATGRLEPAARILRTFAGHVSEGMLPNRFPDAGEPPEYNTVDATLWFFNAIDRYLAHGGDETLGRDLYPVLCDIVEWHRRGTRYGIQVDGGDGLLRAGEPGVALTWMDAKVGDRAVTPRIGKAVEINALWYNALAVMQTLATRLGDRDRARAFAAAAHRARSSFRSRFWYHHGGYLYDVVDMPDGHADASLRPNQIFALSLPHPLLDAAEARAVVDVCAHRLWTPVGLRSLARSEPGYVARYGGAPHERDGAYHQGTVWSWLLGPFAIAHHASYGDAERALAFLEPLASHLPEACMGQISEIFDAEAPHSPRGCFAQAWSVAEVLRAWLEITRTKAPTRARASTPRKSLPTTERT
jgi:predicted glycogen debranching enzyme